MAKREVFFDNGRDYGGNQSNLKYRWEEAPQQREQIKQLLLCATKKEWTDEALARFLTKLHMEGCGYVAATNIIMAKFYGREEAYESLFKKPYYLVDGRVNFDELLVEFYYQERTRRLLPFFNYYVQLPYPGVRGRDLHGNIHLFTKQRGRQIEGHKLPRYSRKRLEQHIKDCLETEHFVILTTYFWPLVLISPIEKKYTNQQIRMHSVVITEYDQERQQFVVSSWGKKYYLAKLPMGVTCYAYL